MLKSFKSIAELTKVANDGECGLSYDGGLIPQTGLETLITDFTKATDSIWESMSDAERKNQPKKCALLIYGNKETTYITVADMYRLMGGTKKNNGAVESMKIFKKLASPEKFTQRKNVWVKETRKGNTLYKNNLTNLLTQRGAFHMISVSKTKYAHLFREIVFEFITGIRENHAEIYKLELANAKASVEKAQAQVDNLEKTICYNNGIKIKYSEFSEYAEGLDLAVEKKDQELILYRQMYGKTVSLYVVTKKFFKTSKPKPRKKKSPRKRVNVVDGIDFDSDDEYKSGSVSDSEEANDSGSADVEYEKPFNRYDFRDFKNHRNDGVDGPACHLMYYSIGSLTAKKEKTATKYRKIKNLTFIDKKHYEEALLRMQTHQVKNNGRNSGVYCCTYDEILDIVSTSLISLKTKGVFGELANARARPF